MAKKTDIVRYTAAEVDAMRARGEDRTGETAAVAQDADTDDDAFDWTRAKIGIPQPKQQLTVRFDRDVVEWFRSQGAGYQTRMNAVLRKFVDATRKSD